jgi:Na+-transporting methylmalonyl-CoA/oxaloacetate decarboxylase gamma subunit
MNAFLSFAFLFVLIAAMVGVVHYILKMVAKEESDIVKAMTDEPEKFNS